MRGFFTATMIALLCTACLGQAWEIELPGIGTFSSPRCIDLSGDGVLDVVMGAGREEFIKCDSAVIALDGKSGEMLWHVPAIDQIFGSAIFQEISGDGIPDVFIGGRSAELFAIDGKTGNVIWNFCKANNIKKRAKQGWFNFYNPQFIRDQDGDQVRDLLVSNGGDVMAEPFDTNRPAGHLVVISSKTGRLIQRAAMPDGKEIYMSIAVIPDGADPKIVFGTGGETVGGNLWLGKLSDVLTGDLTNSLRLDSCASKGYIGPPVLVDIKEDGHLDVITNSVDGRMLAFDGQTWEPLWQIHIPHTESYSSLAVGQFGKDSVPDFFVSYGKGVWPSLGSGIQKLVSGKTGAVLFTDSLGFYQNTTALAYDLSGDGRDEIIMSLNFHELNEIYQKFFYTMLVSINFATGAIERLSEVYQGSNLSSTPWAGDLDQDGYLDIIYFHGTNLRHTYTFDGMKVHRLSTQIPVRRKVKWGAYQGSGYDGIFLRE